MLCDVEGLSYEEIAEIMDAKLGTVRSRIHRGRSMLRKALAHREPAAGRQRYSGPTTPAPVGPWGGVVMTHLGSRVSALVDGRLAPEEEERCWNHVHGCHTCRDLVEHEGWVKTQLAQLSLGPSQTSHDFKSSLVGRCSALSPAPGSALTPPAVLDLATVPDAAWWRSAAARRARASSACWCSASPAPRGWSRVRRPPT